MHLLRDPEFWVAIAALIFVIAVWRPARRNVLSGLDNRTARIRAELDEARRLREEAERLLADYRRRQQEAANEAASIVAQAREEAEHLAAQGARDIEQALARRQRLAEERIAQAEAAALGEIRAAAVDVAIAAARRVIAGEIDERRGAALIDAEISSLPQGLG